MQNRSVKWLRVGHKEVEFAEIIANLSGIAIENARTYGTLQARSEAWG